MSKNVQKCPVFVVNRQKYDKENIMYNCRYLYIIW